jgi:O-antigen/teichoic acid export membrane protein
MTPTSTVTTGKTLTQKKVVFKSIAFNSLTRFLPLMAGFFAVPYIMHQLGVERFGILMLIWSVVGYATFLDLGLGRGLTQHVSKKIGENDLDSLPSIVITVISSTFLLACLGGTLLWFLSNSLVSQLNVTSALRGETEDAFRLMAISLPFLVGSAVTTGVYEAHQKFGFTNLTNWPIVFANFGAPFFILPFSNTLPAMVIAVVASRVLVFSILFFSLRRIMPNVFRHAKIDFGAIKNVFSYSKWLLLNNVICGSSRELDRFFVATLLGAPLVAYLATPAYAISRFHMFISSAGAVIFPTYGIEFIQDPQRCRRIYLKSLTTMMLLMMVPYGLLAIFSKPLLSMWLSPEFSQKAYLCASWLAFAFYMLSLNFIVNSFIEATGRSKLTTTINIFVLPFFICFLYFGIQQFGLVGSAMALFLKELIEFCVKVFIAEKIFQTRLSLYSLSETQPSL